MSSGTEFDVELRFVVSRCDDGTPYAQFKQTWHAVPYDGLLEIEERLLKFEAEMAALGRAQLKPGGGADD